MHRREMVALVAVAVLIPALFAVYWIVFAIPYFAAADKVENDIIASSHGLVAEAVPLDENGLRRYAIWTDVDSSGVYIACQVVRPVLARDGVPTAPFEVHDRTSGLLLATNLTTCPPP